MSSPLHSTDSRSKDEKEEIDMRSRVAIVPDLSQDVFEGTLDPIYEAKAKILNDAIQEIGMGRYQVITPIHICLLQNLYLHVQWHLFFVAGFGWFSYVGSTHIQNNKNKKATVTTFGP